MNKQYSDFIKDTNQNTPAMQEALSTGIFWAVATPVMSNQRISIPSTQDDKGNNFPCLFATEAEADIECKEEIEAFDDFEADVICLKWDGGENIIEINPKTGDEYSFYKWKLICGLG